jgi:prefoldin subunit 5
VTARRYGVEDQVKGLLKVSEDLTSNELSVEDCVGGSRIVNVLQKLRVDVDDFEPFVKGVYEEALAQNFPVGDLVGYAIELLELKAKTGRNYQQILEDYKEKADRISELEDETKGLEDKRRELRKGLDGELQSAKVTGEELQHFIKVRDRLGAMGLPVESLDNLESLLKNCGDLGFEPVALINFYTETGDWQSRRRSIEKATENLELKNAELETEIEELERELTDKTDQMEAVNKLGRMSLTPNTLYPLVECVTRIAAKHGLNNKEAIEKLASDVDSQYDEKLGFENLLVSLRAKHAQLVAEVEQIQRNLDILDANYRERHEAVESLIQLNQLGVSNNDLVSWRTILQENDVDLVSFRKGMKDLGGFNQYLDEKMKTKRELEIKITDLNTVIDELETTRESHIKNMNETSLRASARVEVALLEMTGVIETFEKDFLNPDTGFEAQSKKIVETTHSNVGNLLARTENEWKQKIDQLKEDVQSIVDTVEEVKEAAFIGGREVGKFKALKPIHKIMGREKLQKIEGLMAIQSFLIFAGEFLEDQRFSTARDDCKTLMETISRELLV